MNDSTPSLSAEPGDRIWITGNQNYDPEFVAKLRKVCGDAALNQLGLYWLPPGFKLSVAIPCYNEEKTIRAIVERVRAVPIPKEIVIVDDCSKKDRTREILKEMEQEPDIRVFYHEKNMGKGGALSTAFKQCRGDVVIIQDADLEYDPNEYPKLIQPIVDGRADVVFGSRFKGECVRVHYFWHRVANGILTLLSNFFTDLNLTDMETCYKVFRREVLDGIEIKERRFGVEPELTAKVARTKINPTTGRRTRTKKYRCYEVPISYHGRSYDEGKHIGMKDAFRALYCIGRYWWAD
jgi:glycosyltransferase involved in cell wall biosynthesis